MQQAVTEQSARRLPGTDGERFRRLFLIAAAVCVPFVLSSLALAVFVTPIFADMYAEAGIESPSAIWRLVFSLSHGPGLAQLIVAVAWLIARRTRPWVLFVPAGVLAIAAGAYVPFLYMPLFSSMNVVH